MVPREIRHCVAGYRFLNTQHLVIVSGGGQLDDEWGGAWGHPFALFKWAILARLAGVPYAVISVGIGKIRSRASRALISHALRTACYRSYRDKNSRVLISNLLRAAATEPIVPDIAFSLPPSELPAPAGVRSISQGRPIVAISPIVYCKPQSWPSHDRLLFDNYLREMAKVISQLIRKGYFIVVVWSSLGDDNTILPELLRQLDPESRGKLSEQAYFPAIATWRDLVAVLQDADYLIASRLHSVILGCLAQVPTVAISFDSKVDWVMADLGQTEYLLHIRDLKAEQVLAALAHLKDDRTSALAKIVAYQRQTLPIAAQQYDLLADLASKS